MLYCNILLFLATLFMVLSFARLWKQVYSRLFTFAFGLLLFGLCILIPLITNIVIGSMVVYEPSAIKLGPIVDESYYLIYSVFAVSFSFCYFLSSALSRGVTREPPTEAAQDDMDSGTNQASATESLVFRVSAFISLIGFVIFVRGTGTEFTRLAELMPTISGRFSYYHNPSFSPALLTISSYLLSAVCLYAYYDMKRGFRNRLLSVLVYGVVLLHTATAGGRKLIILVLSGMAVCYVLEHRYRVKKSSFVVAIASVSVLVMAWQLFRTAGWYGRVSIQELITQRYTKLLMQGDLTYFYSASLEAIRQHIKYDIFFPFHMFRNLLLLPLPSSWTFGLKLPDLPQLFDNLVWIPRGPRTEANFPPGFFGMFILNFSYVGVLIGPILTLGLLRWLDHRKPGSVFWAIGAATSISLFLRMLRGTLGGFYIWVFLFLLYQAIAVAAAWQPGRRRA